MANNDPGYWRGRAAFYAQKYGINPDVFMKQIQMESGFNPNARSSAGAQGIAQIMPFHNVGTDPETQLAWAAQHDAQNYKKYGNWKDVLSVYNSGRPWARGQGITETSNYVSKILGGGNPTNPSKGQSGAPVQPSMASAASTIPGGFDMKKLGALYFLQQASGEGSPQNSDLLSLAMARMGPANAAWGSPGGTNTGGKAGQGQSGLPPIGKPSNATGLNADFASRLAAFEKATGTTTKSGFRSVAEQTQLWKAAVQKYGSEAAARKWVAPPGHSMHNKGLAVDLSGNLPLAHKLAGKYGLYFPMPWEPWHVQPIGT